MTVLPFFQVFKCYMYTWTATHARFCKLTSDWDQPLLSDKEHLWLQLKESRHTLLNLLILHFVCKNWKLKLRNLGSEKDQMMHETLSLSFFQVFLLLTTQWRDYTIIWQKMIKKIYSIICIPLKILLK